MNGTFLSRFTPSLLPPEALEQMFVQRSKLAETIVMGVRESALTDNKHYFLVTGPRGIGKTHLVSLLVHRIRNDDELRKKLRIAWLREEEYGVASYLDLLLVTLRALREGEGLDELEAEEKRIRESRDEAEARDQAESVLVDVASERPVLIVAENLDEIFRGLEANGQYQFRALIQNHPVFTILGTAQSLFDGVTNRDQPFYGFFDVYQLDELTLESAISLVARIAEHHGNAELGRMLSTPLGRARMRAVHHLAAGNPRVYVIFSQFLSAASLDQLVKPLLHTLDDLTPYYQGRMAWLTPQQRKIVEYLCERRGAVTVSQLAKDNFITSQTASSQLRKLDEQGYVRSSPHGRASYYELREPLLRLTLEVKKLRGAPVRLIVEFLRLWYSERELARRLSTIDDLNEKQYVEAALELKRRDGDDAIRKACRADFDKLVDAGETLRAVGVAAELLEVSGTVEDYDRVICMKGADDELVATALLRKAVALAASNDTTAVAIYDEVISRFGCRAEVALAESAARAFISKGGLLAAANKPHDEIAVYDEVVRRYSKSLQFPLDVQVAEALFRKAVTLSEIGESISEIEAYDQLIRLYKGRSEPELAGRVAVALVNKAATLGQLGHHVDEVAAYDQVIAQPGDMSDVRLAEPVARALLHKGISLYSRERLAEAVREYDEVLSRFGQRSELQLLVQVARALICKAHILGFSGRDNEEIELYDNVIERFSGRPEPALAEAVARALVNKALTLASLKRNDDAAVTFDEIIHRFEDSSEAAIIEHVGEALLGKSMVLAVAGRRQEEIKNYDQVIPWLERHPNLSEKEARARLGKGIALAATEHLDDALSAYDEAIRRFAHHQNLDLSEPLAKILVNKAILLGEMGRSQEEIGVYDDVIRKYVHRQEIAVAEPVARAMLHKGITLQLLMRLDEALDAYDDVMRAFASRSELPLRQAVERALVNKASIMGSQGRFDDAVQVYDEYLALYADRPEHTSASRYARVLYSKAIALRSMKRPADAMRVYDQIIERFAGSSEPGVLEPVAQALLNKGRALSAVGRLSESISIFDDVVGKFGNRSEPSMVDIVASGLGSKAASLALLNRSDEAIATYSEVIERFGNRPEPFLAEKVANALFGKALELALSLKVAQLPSLLEDAVVRLTTIDASSADMGFLRYLLRRTHDVEQWNRLVRPLVEAFRKHNRLSALGVGLVRSISQLRERGSEPDLPSRWLGVWENACGSDEEMQISMRILKAAVAYLERGDQPALHALPMEERDILESVLSDPQDS
ncbi:MAG TPA: tetratricopeptide repeat protein [Candidatus Limnocylindrales bacterium]|nr:tetratricopeptide repeat protein [Candidatus Limnocylindrales bacterium]